MELKCFFVVDKLQATVCKSSEALVKQELGEIDVNLVLLIAAQPLTIESDLTHNLRVLAITALYFNALLLLNLALHELLHNLTRFAFR